METLVEVNKKEKDWIVIFTFSGELDETNADKTFSSIYEEIWDFADKKIIFNLKGLTYMNSKSIGYIADVFSNIEENEWQMHITNCSEWVKDVLELVWITTIIPVNDKEETAIETMSA